MRTRLQRANGGTAPAPRQGPRERRTGRIGRTLALAALERDSSTLLLDRIAIGVLVVDGQARLRSSSAAGARVLAARDGLSLGNSGLEAASLAATQALRGAIADALSERACAGAGTRLALARPSGARPYLVEVTALDPAADDRRPGQALAMIVVSDGASAAAPSPDALRILYGLTPAEAELAIRLAEGRTLDEIRTERGVTSNTARGQLKKVFLKTGTHRQADLVRVVLQGRIGHLGAD